MPDDKLYLPEHFDGTTVLQVSKELLERRGQPVELNAERVKTAGALGLQMLVSVTKQWQRDDHSFQVVGASKELSSAGDMLGLAPADFGVLTGQVAT